jgi:hypothetical protein
MALDRTAWSALVDSSGTPDTGTVWNKNRIASVILDPVDDEIARLDAVRGCRARRTTNQSLADSVITKVQLATESFDTDGWFDNVTNYRCQPTVAGKYLVVGYVNLENVTSGVVYVFKNAGLTPEVAQDGHWPAANYANLSASDVVTFNGTTDYVELYAQHFTGAARNLIGATLTAILLGS